MLLFGNAKVYILLISFDVFFEKKWLLTELVKNQLICFRTSRIADPNCVNVCCKLIALYIKFYRLKKIIKCVNFFQDATKKVYHFREDVHLSDRLVLLSYSVGSLFFIFLSVLCQKQKQKNEKNRFKFNVIDLKQ